MVRRGCTLILVIFAAIFAIYYVFFSRYFEPPGNLIAAAFGAVFGSMGLGAMSHLLWARRDTAAFARAGSHADPAHGSLVVAAGPIRPLGVALTSPFGGAPCVAYDYEVTDGGTTGRGTTGRGKGDVRPTDVAGFAMAASAIETPRGSVRMLGFALLDEFPQVTDSGPERRARAERYVASTTFERMEGLAALRLVTAMDDALADADGVVRKDFRLKEGEIPFEQRRLKERIVGVGQQVCALGRYDADKRALVPGSTPNRLWPGTAADVRRRIVAEGRSQAKIGFVFFAVSHAMLGAGFYLSETRHAREPEAGQASVIRSAIQSGDVAALERAVRRGANPNARDAFGDVVLLDVRDPRLAAALIRLGADPNVHHRGDEDTPLIRAARMGNAPLVRVLLAAGADVRAMMVGGATALDEATRGEHAEVVSLLQAALASDDVNVER